MIHPTLSAVYPFEQTAEATRLVQINEHSGKIGILCAARHEGLGVANPALREKIGAGKLTTYHHQRNHAGAS